MGRRLRVDFEGGWFHVMNRGAGRRQIFFTRGDGEAFEALLAEGSEATGAEVHAYCLMPNHYHLLLHLPRGGLSAMMHSIGSVYTRRLNQRLASDGPVFRGRFHSLVIDGPQYLDHVGRYIHRNPLELSSRPLDRYRWSSYRFYVGAARAPDWLRTSSLADMHAGLPGYREFVEGADSVSPATPALVGWAIDTALHEHGERGDIGELHSLQRTLGLLMLDEATTAQRVALETLLALPSPNARKVAIYRSRQRAAAAPVLTELARRALDLAA
jgi:REP element-mobilizing transposase RayT